MLTYLTQGIVCGFSAAALPGAFQAYVISRALEQGWRRSWPLALAPLVSDAPIVALVLFALTRVPVSVQRLLTVAGGLFILYLARDAFVAWRDFQTADPAPASQRGLLKAAFMNVTSPGPYMYWSLVAGPILLAGWRQSPASGLGFLIGFYLTMVAVLWALILLFGAARQLGPTVNRALLAISAAALAGFGAFQLWQGVAGILSG